MRKACSRGIGGLMLAGAGGFIAYAFRHPEFSWPWPDLVSYSLYGAYMLIALVLLIVPSIKPRSMPSGEKAQAGQ